MDWNTAEVPQSGKSIVMQAFHGILCPRAGARAGLRKAPHGEGTGSSSGLHPDLRCWDVVRRHVAVLCNQACSPPRPLLALLETHPWLIPWFLTYSQNPLWQPQEQIAYFPRIAFVKIGYFLMSFRKLPRRNISRYLLGEGLTSKKIDFYDHHNFCLAVNNKLNLFASTFEIFCLFGGNGSTSHFLRIHVVMLRFHSLHRTFKSSPWWQPASLWSASGM